MAGKPVQCADIGIVIATLPYGAACGMSFPMCVDEAPSMFMMRITLMRVAERSLGKRKQKARGHAKMERAAHDPLF